MTEYPCDKCRRNRDKCRGNGCRRWEMWFREHWAYVHAFALAYGVKPTTPPEEVIEIEDEGTEEADS